MLKNKLKSIYTITFIAFVLLCAASIYTGRLPAVVAAFKENIEAEKASKQLLEPYNVMDNTFHFELPDKWDTNEVSFAGGEILYHMNFTSQDKRIHGFVQVWKLSKPLKQFIDASKESAVGVVDFKYFDVKEIMINNKKGYLIDYSRANSQGDYNRAYEVFVEGCTDKVYRMSFFVPEKEWRNYYKVHFDKIIHTMNIKK